MRELSRFVVVLSALIATGAAPARAQSGSGPSVAVSSVEADSLGVAHDVATVKGGTSVFRSLADARSAGWSTQVTGCMADPAGAGAMGFHFVNQSLMDGEVNVAQPEAIVYEPIAIGRVAFVAVEYIVPFDQWTDSAPPRLLGHEFTRNEYFKAWTLHAWVGKDNPRGMFADWNPKVSCVRAAGAVPADPSRSAH